MGERTGAARAWTFLPPVLAAVYFGAALRAPLEPALLLALGPLAAALAVARTRRLAVLLFAAAPAVALALRAGLAAEVPARCACTPALNAALLASALIAGSRLGLAAAAALALGPLGAACCDLTAAGLRAGVWRPLPWETGFAFAGAAALLVLAAVLRRIGAPSAIAGVLACAVLATGLSWQKSLELPALVYLVERPAVLEGRAARWARGRLLERGDEAAVRALLARTDDAGLPAVYAAAAKLGAVGDAILESELARPGWGPRRAALSELARRGPLGARPAFLEAVATHRVPWPEGAYSAQPSLADTLAALESPDRERWYPAAMRLLRGRAAGPIEGEPPVAQLIARLAGHLSAAPGLEEYRLLWHPAEGVRLAAATAIALNPAGAGRAGEAPRLAHVLAQAREGDAAARFDPARTPFGPTAPLRLAIFGELYLRDRLSPDALAGAARDPLPIVAAMAARGRSGGGAPSAKNLLELTDLRGRVDAGTRAY